MKVSKLIGVTILSSLFSLAAVVKADQLDDYVQQQMRKARLPGVAVLVLKKGKIIKRGAYGLASVDPNVPVTPDTVYPLASVTKVFTATSIFMLIEQGKLRSDDKISTLLPNLPPEWKDVTVLNCLSHTSGIPDLLTEDEAWIASTQEEALAKLAPMPLMFPSGEKSSYNQSGFLMLKMIIERISGLRIEDFLKKQIFEPLEMHSAQFGDSLDIIPNRAALYTRWAPAANRVNPARKPNGSVVISPDRIWHDHLLYPAFVHGGAGLNLSAADFARFDSALTQGRLMKIEALKRMWTPYRLNNGELGDFAEGWQASLWNGHRIVFMVGAGYVCYAHLVDDDVSVVWMANGRGGVDVRDLVRNVYDLYIPGIGGTR